MSTTPSTAQSKLYAGLLPVVASVEAVAPADLKNDRFLSVRSWLRKLKRLAFRHYQIAFFIGVAVTLAWQFHGDPPRERVASSYSQLGWMAPQPALTAPNAPDLTAPAAPAVASPDQQVSAMSLDLDAVRQGI